MIGFVTKSDFLLHTGLSETGNLSERLRSFFLRTPYSYSIKPEVVVQIMSKHVKTASVHLPIAQLVRLMADDGVHQIPVIGDERRLAVMVAQSDMVVALYANNLTRVRAGVRLVS